MNGDGAASRQPAMRTDLLVKLRISLILQRRTSRCWRDAMRLPRIGCVRHHHRCSARSGLSLLPSALARDNGQWENSPPHVRRWFQGLRQPDNPRVSCCGEADAYEADIFEVDGGRYVAIITDGKGEIPERDKNPRAQPQDEMGRGKPDRARHHLHRHPGAGLLLRRPRRGVTAPTSADSWFDCGRLAAPICLAQRCCGA